MEIQDWIGLILKWRLISEKKQNTSDPPDINT
jgi:hypothetical protein